jgi:hypothetical protein
MNNHIKYLFTSFLAGTVAKLYDDIYDNDTLVKYKDKFLLEILKGIHYVCFTAVSIEAPIFFLLSYTVNISALLTDKRCFELPYEKSLFFSFGLLFLLIKYENILSNINKLDILVCLSVCLGAIAETQFIKAEYSVSKLLSRMFILSCLLSVPYLIPLSYGIKYLFLWCAGYFAVSTIVQYYSLYIHKKCYIIQNTIQNKDINNNVKPNEITQENLSNEKILKDKIEQIESNKYLEKKNDRNDANDISEVNNINEVNV